MRILGEWKKVHTQIIHQLIQDHIPIPIHPLCHLEKKWKGKLWSEVDDDYIMWGCEKCSVPWQKELFEVERQRRAMKQDDINQSTPNGETEDIPF